MKNVLINSILFSIFVLVFIPQITMASWWNPLTWSWPWDKKVLIQEQIQAPLVSTSEEKLTKETITLPVKKTRENNITTAIKPPQVVDIPIYVSTSSYVNTDQKINLSIFNINKKVTKDMAVITWETNIPAKSRLTLDNGKGDVFESENGINTKHRVEIHNLTASKEYKYMIFARTEDGEKTDDSFNSFIAFREYSVSLGKLEDGCRTIILKDTAERFIKGVKIKTRGILKTNNTTVQKPSSIKETNSDGEIEYCEKANSYNISFTVDGEYNEVNLFVPFTTTPGTSA